MVSVKICGLDRADAVDAAVAGGALFTGFVFYPPSPRNLDPANAAALTERVPDGVQRVGLFVDPTDEEIAAVLEHNRLDIVQLHGQEPPARVREVRAATGLKVMKAIRLGSEADLEVGRRYEDIADMLLFDALPPETMADALPGGNALAFDWGLLRGTAWRRPWFLAGGLTAQNLGDAVAASGARAVDVSSGVEKAPGVKDLAKIEAFLATAAAIAFAA